MFNFLRNKNTDKSTKEDSSLAKIRKYQSELSEIESAKEKIIEYRSFFIKHHVYNFEPILSNILNLRENGHIKVSLEDFLGEMGKSMEELIQNQSKSHKLEKLIQAEKEKLGIK